MFKTNLYISTNRHAIVIWSQSIKPLDCQYNFSLSLSLSLSHTHTLFLSLSLFLSLDFWACVSRSLFVLFVTAYLFRKF